MCIKPSERSRALCWDCRTAFLEIVLHTDTSVMFKATRSKFQLSEVTVSCGHQEWVQKPVLSRNDHENSLCEHGKVNNAAPFPRQAHRANVSRNECPRYPRCVTHQLWHHVSRDRIFAALWPAVHLLLFVTLCTAPAAAGIGSLWTAIWIIFQYRSWDVGSGRKKTSVEKNFAIKHSMKSWLLVLKYNWLWDKAVAASEATTAADVLALNTELK